MTSEGDEFKVATFGAPIHGATKRRVTTVDHLIHVFYDRRARTSEIYKFFIMIFKDILKDVTHKTIMTDMKTKENPPLKIEGQGS